MWQCSKPDPFGPDPGAGMKPQPMPGRPDDGVHPSLGNSRPHVVRNSSRVIFTLNTATVLLEFSTPPRTFASRGTYRNGASDVGTRPTTNSDPSPPYALMPDRRSASTSSRGRESGPVLRGA